MVFARTAQVAIAASLCSLVSGYDITAVAYFNSDDIYGTVTFTQSSNANSVTTIQTALAGIEYDYHDWHVHTVPTTPKACMTSANYDDHWNPTGASGECTPDLSDAAKLTNCAVGELAGKLGLLHRNTSNSVFTDANMPLAGRNSIIGHSLVIHNPIDDSIKDCATIELSGNVLTHTALFRGEDESNLFGTISFSQLADYPDSSTYVQINLKYDDEGATSSSGHGVKVLSGTDPADDDAASCTATTTTFNPSSATGTCTTALSDAQMKTTCAVGDLSGRHGNLALPARLAYADPNAPLSGANSILHKQLGLYTANSGASKWICANVLTADELAEELAPYQPPVFDDDGSATEYGPRTLAVAYALAALLAGLLFAPRN